jgi:prepilin-type N-terminal cleavage/methylation domain-containing protein
VKRRKTTAFTLIELLVVIAIIALLIAILLPALQRAKFAAEVVQCTSRIRQMALSTYMYTNDHRGYFPDISDLNHDGATDAAVSYAYGSWAWQIAPYTGARGTSWNTNFRSAPYVAMQCPSRVTGLWAGGYPHWLYSMPWSLNFTPSRTWGSGGEVPQRGDNFKQPSKLGVFVDGGVYATAIHPPHIDTYGVQGHPAANIAEPNHQGRGIAHAYYDGHAGFTYVDRLTYTAVSVRPPWWQKSFWQVPGSWGQTNGYNDY